MREPGLFANLRRSLQTLDERLLPALRQLGLVGKKLPKWVNVLQRQALPAVKYDVPVILTTICGGGSTGKSTLFNSLAGRTISKTGFRAGLTQRIVICGHPDIMDDEKVVQNLLFRFKTEPQRWNRPDDATEPGSPLTISSLNIHENLVLLDTPDFDTGQGEELKNRELALPALQTSEVLLYLFTNAIYNNASNTSFMREVIGAVGGRETILIYRVSRVLPDEDAMEHLRKVATSLYPASPLVGPHELPEQILGCYRIHESDEIALGKEQPKLTPMAGTPPLEELLDGIDVVDLKERVLQRELHEIIEGAGESIRGAQRAVKELGLFRQVAEQAVIKTAAHALRSFPQDEATKFVQQVWQRSSPTPLRVMRGTGKVIGSPVHLAMMAYRTGQRYYRGESLSAKGRERLQREALENDLIEAASQLRTLLLESRQSLRMTDQTTGKHKPETHAAEHVDTFLQQHGANEDGLPKLRWAGASVTIEAPTPAPLHRALDALESMNWADAVARIREESADLFRLSDDLKAELETEILGFRENMGVVDKVRESVFSSLTVLPPVIAITYVLSTGDPVTGGAIAVKLSGALGLGDLWAVVAIPASSGLNEVDRKQLSALLQPIIRRWFESRLVMVRDLYQSMLLAPFEEVWGKDAGDLQDRFAEATEALERLQGSTHEA